MRSRRVLAAVAALVLGASLGLSLLVRQAVDAGAATVVAVGDIACSAEEPVEEQACAHGRTAELALDLEPDAALLLGDLQYPDATIEQFSEPGGFTGTWSRLGDRSLPTAGNHEWHTEGAAGYLDALGSRLERDHPFWYSRDVGPWHVVSLSSECDDVGGCDDDSPQMRWLRADLAEADGRPTLLFWHRPRWSTGLYGPRDELAPLWDAAVEDRDVQLVLASHDHNYQRFGPLDSDGAATEDGPASIVVGTGGRSHYCDRNEAPTEPLVFDCTSYGVLQLELREDGYDWEFLAATGELTDEGSAGLRAQR